MVLVGKLSSHGNSEEVIQVIKVIFVWGGNEHFLQTLVMQTNEKAMVNMARFFS